MGNSRFYFPPFASHSTSDSFVFVFVDFPHTQSLAFFRARRLYTFWNCDLKAQKKRAKSVREKMWLCQPILSSAELSRPARKKKQKLHAEAIYNLGRKRAEWERKVFLSPPIITQFRAHHYLDFTSLATRLTTRTCAGSLHMHAVTLQLDSIPLCE